MKVQIFLKFLNQMLTLPNEMNKNYYGRNLTMFLEILKNEACLKINWFCQAQPKLQLAELALVLLSSTHPYQPTHPSPLPDKYRVGLAKPSKA